MNTLYNLLQWGRRLVLAKLRALADKAVGNELSILKVTKIARVSVKKSPEGRYQSQSSGTVRICCVLLGFQLEKEDVQGSAEAVTPTPWDGADWGL